MACHTESSLGSSVVNTNCSNSCVPKSINIVCYQMIIPPTEKIIAQQYDVNSNIKTFILPLEDEHGVSWSDKSFYVVTPYDKVQITGNNLIIGDDYITLKWVVGNLNTQAEGDLPVQIEISGTNYEKYTNIGTFIVYPTVNIDQQIIDTYPTILQQLQSAIITKQDILVSGTNIKTINNQSVLGTGNLDLNAGLVDDVRVNGISVVVNKIANIDLASELNTKENVSNKVTSISSSSTDSQYPSAKCVYDLIGDIESTLQNIRGVN